MTDVIVSQAEISVAVNKIDFYTSYLSTAVNEYCSILRKLSEVGIRDTEINASLYVLQGQVSALEQRFPEFNETIKSTLNDFLKAIESTDKFVYPYSELDKISNMLSCFFD